MKAASGGLMEVELGKIAAEKVPIQKNPKSYAGDSPDEKDRHREIKRVYAGSV